MACSRKAELIRGSMFVMLGLSLLWEGGCTVNVQQTPRATYEPAPPPPQPAPQPQSAVVVEEYQPPPAPVVTVYETDLSPYGSWVDVQGYGRCWSPSGRPSDWQPYTVGHWVYSDYGWTWVPEDDEAQWGVVTYHYGRWYLDPSQGWVWIPGTTWAPAWVAWREGGGYCGWAPLPPQAGFGTQVSVAVVDQYLPPERYVYCNEQYVNDNRVDQHIVHNNVTIINQTVNITNITVENDHVVNRGISVTNVQNATGRPVEKVALAPATTPEQARTLAAAGQPVVYAPPAVQKAEEQRMAAAKPQAKNPSTPAPANPRSANVAEPQPTSPTHVYQAENENSPADKTPPPGGQKPVNAQEEKPSPDQQQAADAKARQEQEPAAKQQEQQGAADTKAQADAKAQDDAKAQAQAKAKADEKAKADDKTDEKAKADDKTKQQQEPAENAKSDKSTTKPSEPKN
jgi:hypothetical protein